MYSNSANVASTTVTRIDEPCELVNRTIQELPGCEPGYANTSGVDSPKTAPITPVCPHRFSGKPAATPHYCSYIQVPGLLEILHAKAETTDDRTVCSFLFSCGLWLKLQLAELHVLSGLSRFPMDLNEYYEICKRLKRCTASIDILLWQAAIVESRLDGRCPNIRLRLCANASDLSLLQETLAIARNWAGICYRSYYASIEGGVAGDLQLSIIQLSDSYCNKVERFARGFEELLHRLASKGRGKPLPLSEVLPVEKLALLSRATLARHHPQALAANSTRVDELTFVTAHQAFEVWFPTMVAALEEARDCLADEQHLIWKAESVIRWMAEMYRLFCAMIVIPQTMTAAEYMTFRDQIGAGSGAESIGFRSLEILIGQRDPRFVTNIRRMELITPELEKRLAEPSLYTAFLDLLQMRGVLSKETTETAFRLAQILWPVGSPSRYPELTALAEALLDLEQGLNAWRTTHLAMVDRMIGYLRPSLGVGGRPPTVASSDPNDLAFEGRPYLIQTLGYERIFRELWDARNKMSKKADAPLYPVA